MNTIEINLAEFGGILAGLWVVGAILKNAFPSLPNRIIPLIIFGLGTVAYVASLSAWTDSKAWIAGLVASATAVGAHSGIKNSFEKNEKETP